MKNRKREICTSGSVRDEDGQPPHLLGRRKFLHLATGAAALSTVPRVARAQAYPTRPVRIIVTSAAGGSPDIIARLIGQWLSERLGQPIIVDNRSGASGNIGTEIVVRTPSHQRRARRCRLQLQPAPALVRGAFTCPLVDPLTRPLGRPASPNPVPQNFLHGRLSSVTQATI